jgi:hypothetical protein
MKTFSGLVALLLVMSSVRSTAQSKREQMAMPSNTLLVAQLDAQQVAGGSSSRATGMGAFLLDPVQRTLGYSLTYEGLQAGSPKSIALFNFGKGKNGELIYALCGGKGQPCPEGNSATISGRIERNALALNNHLIGEFDSQRIYVEVVGANGNGEIRGQLAANGAMVPIANYVAHLTPSKGSNSKGSGTAIFSEVYLPGGKVSVFYAATVANTSGPPVNVGLVPGERLNSPLFTTQTALPNVKFLSSRDDVAGGSLEGSFQVNSADRNALFAKRLLSSGKGGVGIAITTGKFPQGELFGTLVPVH